MSRAEAPTTAEYHASLEGILGGEGAHRSLPVPSRAWLHPPPPGWAMIPPTVGIAHTAAAGEFMAALCGRAEGLQMATRLLMRIPGLSRITDLEGVIIAGRVLALSIVDRWPPGRGPRAEEAPYIDIHIQAPNAVSADRVAGELLVRLQGASLVRRKRVTTFTFRDRNGTHAVRLSHQRHSSALSALQGYDVATDAVGWLPAADIYAITQAGQLAYMAGLLIVNPARRAPGYEARLGMCLRQGFGLLLPHFPFDRAPTRGMLDPEVHPRSSSVPIHLYCANMRLEYHNRVGPVIGRTSIAITEERWAREEKETGEELNKEGAVQRLYRDAARQNLEKLHHGQTDSLIACGPPVGYDLPSADSIREEYRALEAEIAVEGNWIRAQVHRLVRIPSQTRLKDAFAESRREDIATILAVERDHALGIRAPPCPGIAWRSADEPQPRPRATPEEYAAWYAPAAQ